MKAKKLLFLLLTLTLVIGLTILPVSAGSCDTCMDADNDDICDVCKECVGDCYDWNSDPDHNCDGCGKENIEECHDWPYDGDHTCDECGQKDLNDCWDVSDDGDHNCDECGKENVSDCHDYYSDGDHTCDDCGKENVSNCWDDDFSVDHICEDCNTTFPCYDTDNNHVCDNCYIAMPECDAHTTDRCSVCGAVRINQVNFPDPNFRAWVLDRCGKDEILSAGEGNSSWYCDFDNMSITSLQGIEYLPGVTELHVRSNHLVSLDLSKNTNLRYLYLDNNLLTSLDVTNCPNLKRLSIDNNYITSLDLSKNPDLETLYCSENQLSSLDLSKNPALTNVYCYDNQLTSLVLGNKPVLNELSCYANQLTALDVAQAPMLETLSCSSNQLTALDVTKCPALTTLYCSGNKLTALNTSVNTLLEWLECSSNPLTNLDLSKNTLLRTLDATDTKLTALDTSKQAYLTSLDIRNNEIPSIDVSKNSYLKWLTVADTKLTTLDLSANTMLENLNFLHTMITNLDLSKNTKLRSVYGSCDYPIELDANYQFDLTTLPGNFDVSKASNWSTQFTVDGTKLTLKEAYRKNTNLSAVYTYDLGNGQSVNFTLDVKLPAPSSNPDPTPDPNPNPNPAQNYTIDTWEQLKELASHTYEKETQIFFSRNAPESIVIDADFTIPENLVVFAESIRFVLPEGVTLTICKNAGFRAILELEGSIKNSGYVLMRVQDADTVVDVSRIDCSEGGYIQLWYYSPLPNLQAYRNLLATAEANPHLRYILSFNSDFPFVVSEDLTIPKNVSLSPSSGSAELIINEGCTLINRGLLETGRSIRINGTLVNDGEIHFNNSRQDPKISLGEKGRIIGYGGLCLFSYESAEDAFEGIDLSHYQVERLENWFSSDPAWVVHYRNNTKQELIRLAGSNRYETAVKVADKLKSQLGVQKFDAVVLANGYNFADALSGSYLAAVKEAPILLTWIGKDKYNYLNEYTVNYVKENLAQGGTVYILGGTEAVPQMVDDLLTGYNVVRLAGANRFETNLLILKEAGVKPGDEVLVCTATGFADSLSASAVGKPILLVHKKLSDNQKAYLGTLSNCSYTMIGGTSAVSDAVMAEFGAYGSTSRLAGSNRFETSVKVAEKYFYYADNAVLAYAKDFPDGLCGGPLAYAKGCPLILTMTKGEAKAAEYIKNNRIQSGTILGGEKLISNDSVLIIFY